MPLSTTQTAWTCDRYSRLSVAFPFLDLYPYLLSAQEGFPMKWDAISFDALYIQEAGRIKARL